MKQKLNFDEIGKKTKRYLCYSDGTNEEFFYFDEEEDKEALDKVWKNIILLEPEEMKPFSNAIGGLYVGTDSDKDFTEQYHYPHNTTLRNIIYCNYRDEVYPATFKEWCREKFHRRMKLTEEELEELNETKEIEKEIKRLQFARETFMNQIACMLEKAKDNQYISEIRIDFDRKRKGFENTTKRLKELYVMIGRSFEEFY